MRSPSSHRRILERIAHDVLVDHGLVPDFSREAMRQLDRIDGPALPEGDEDIADLRGLPWCSIDNDDSRDLDQLSASEPSTDGATRVRVAIADVDALVRKDTPLDEQARQNTTSIYTPVRIFPMLPERLSTDLTSLNPHEDRLAVVVDMVIESDGELRSSSIQRAQVRNQAKLAYAAVGAWLEGTGPLPEAAERVPGLDARLKEQDAVAQALRARRQEEGALFLETIEAKPVLDGDRLVALRAEATNHAKQLIEELMVACNGVAARFLEGRGIAALRRVVRSPERWQRIVDVAEELGEQLPSSPDSSALEKFLMRRRKADPVRFPDLSLTIIKLMGAGEYVVQQPGKASIGHFGLAVMAYTHSTAPNRRYPDLIEQRMLKAAIADRRSPYSVGELSELAEHCSAQEDGSNRVERHVRKSAAALLLEDRVGERFDGIVTGASRKGTYVRVFRPPVEGRVISGWDGMRVGARVRVKLVDVDVQQGHIDFARA